VWGKYSKTWVEKPKERKGKESKHWERREELQTKGSSSGEG